MKNIIRNFKSPLLASLNFISVLFIQEFVLRFVLPDFNPNHHIRFNKATDASPALGVQNATFRLVKNSGDYNVTVRFNEHGFRDTKNIKEDGTLTDYIKLPYKQFKDLYWLNSQDNYGEFSFNVTGATNDEFDPINTLSFILVLLFLIPS